MIPIFFRLFLGLVLAGASGAGAIYAYLGWSEGVPAAERSFFAEAPRTLVIAHRGGAGLYPENTLTAFQSSHKLGTDVLELDVRMTSDGVLVVIHDSTIDRTTDGTGRVSEIPFEDLKRFDAGYRFSSDGGKSYPFRASGVTIPALKEVFDSLPEARFNVEMKQEGLSGPLCTLVKAQNASERIVVASFRQQELDEFRRLCPEVATSAGPSEVTAFLAMYKTGLASSYSPEMQAIQTPERVGALEVVSPEFVSAADKLNLKVHVWTVNESDDMRRLIDWRVHGIMTDHPDLLLRVLGRN